MTEKFDYEQALADIKAGKPITGKDSILSPLIKQLTEAALEERWGQKYPIVIKSWRKKWENLSIFFEGRLDDALKL